jgi:HD-like signal output (HDOD) protein
METVKRIIIMVSERPRYRSWFPDLNKLLLQLWVHVSMTALSAQWLAQRLHLAGIQEICFLGGLMHDIGKVAIICAIDEMRKTRSIEKKTFDEALQELIEDNHCQIGYEIMKRWEIPDVYCQIARDHHKEEFAADDLPLMVVRIANKCSSLTENQPAEQLMESPESQTLNIDETTLLELQKILGIHKATTA